MMNGRLAAACCTAVLVGCGAQGIFLGGSGSYLLTARDVLTVPGRPVDLHAELRAGDLLAEVPGVVVLFNREGHLYRAAETNAEGQALVQFAPAEPGNYRFEADVSPVGLPGDPPAPQPLLVACRTPDTPLAVVDMDKTIVAEGFQSVLLGDPAPMADSPRVLHRLAEDRVICYLTHRPEFFGPKSKAWLVRYGFPPGPVLLAGTSEFLRGSGAFKAERLAELREMFENVEIGIGDKISDAQAYHENGMRAFLIIHPPDPPTREGLQMLIDDLDSLSADVQVVTDWSQIERVLYGGASYPRPDAQDMLREKLAALPETEHIEPTTSGSSE